LTTLRRLCICRCGLTGRIPSEIGRLVGLEELQLFGNQLSGSVPASISCLTNLKLLSLGEYTGGNNFTSEPLPQCLASLVHLEALFMANCNIKGQLPDWLGNLTGDEQEFGCYYLTYFKFCLWNLFSQSCGSWTCSATSCAARCPAPSVGCRICSI